MRCWESDQSSTDTRLRVWLAISALVPALAALLGGVTALIANSVRGSEPSGRHGREFRVDAMAGAGGEQCVISHCALVRLSCWSIFTRRTTRRLV